MRTVCFLLRRRRGSLQPDSGRARWYAGKRASFLGIDEQVGGSLFGAGDSVAIANFAETLGSSLAGGYLSAEVAFAFFGCADIVEEEANASLTIFPPRMILTGGMRRPSW